MSGISFDISDIEEVSISHKAFTRMPNLRFLKIYKSKDDRNDIVHIPEEMELPRRVRLLHWEAYPSKCLPRTFNVEYLVELNLPNNKLEKLWGGTQVWLRYLLTYLLSFSAFVDDRCSSLCCFVLPFSHLRISGRCFFHGHLI